MAESLVFDFASRGASGLQRDIRQTGDNMALAAKGARLLKDQLEAQRKAADASARASLSLAKADKILEDAERELSGEALKADLALRRQADAAQKAGRASDEAAGKGGIGGLVGSLVGVDKAAGGANSKVSTFARAMGALDLASGLAEPAVSALLVTAGGLGAAFVSAAAGLGAFSVVAGAVFTKASDAANKAGQAQQAYRAKVAAIEDTYKRQVAAATNASQRQAAEATKQSALQAALKARVQATTQAFEGMTKPQIQLAHAITGVKDEWNAFLAKATPGVASVLERAFGVLPDVFKALQQFLPPVEVALKVIIDDVKAGLESPYWQRFISFLSVSAVPAMLNIAKSAGNIAHGVAGILTAFAPVQQSMTQGLVSLTDKFAKWGATLSSHSGFQALMSQWKQNWPLMRQGLETFAKILKNIAGDIFGLSTPANSRALWQVANPLLAAAEDLSTHPALVDTLLYLLAIGKAGSQISGVFSSLKTGWGTLSKVLGFLSGGKISLGMQSAGDTMLVASQNMIKAADTMAGASARSAAGSAGGAAAGAAEGGFLARIKGVLPVILAGLAEVSVAVEGVALIFHRSFGGELAYMGHQFQKLFVDPVRRALSYDFPIWAHTVSASFSVIGKAAVAFGHFWADQFAGARHTTAAFGHDLAASFDAWRHLFATFGHNVASVFDAIRHTIASAWNAVWNNTVAQARNGIGDTVGWFRGLTGRVLGALFGLGHQLYAFAHAALNEFLSGFKSVGGSVLSWVGNFVSNIWSKVKGFFGIHSPSSLFYSAGKNLMLGLEKGIKEHAHRAENAARDASGGVGGALGGSAAANEAIARRLFPWPASMWPAFNYVEMREAGYSLTARNPSSGAYGVAQFIEGPSEYYRYGGDPNTAGGQFTAMFNYIRQRYGTPLAAAAHEQAFNWYGSGLDAIVSKPTVIGVGERGAERVQVTPVHAARGGGGSGRPAVVIRFGSTGNPMLDNAMKTWLKETVRVDGGGDVQVAFGSN